MRDLVDGRSGNRCWWIEDPAELLLEGHLFLSGVMDMYSRKLVGWFDARRPQDRPGRRRARDGRHPPAAAGRTRAPLRPRLAAQYTSLAFGRTLRESGPIASMGSRRDAYGNAACESVISTLKVERIKRHRYRSRDEARLSIFRYIETFYNPRRRHSSLGGVSPDEYERRCQKRQQEGEIDTIETTRAA